MSTYLVIQAGSKTAAVQTCVMVQAFKSLGVGLSADLQEWVHTKTLSGCYEQLVTAMQGRYRKEVCAYLQ